MCTYVFGGIYRSDSSLISAGLAVPEISFAFPAIDSNLLQAWDFYYEGIDLNFIVRPITLGGKQRSGSWLRQTLDYLGKRPKGEISHRRGYSCGFLLTIFPR